MTSPVLFNLVRCPDCAGSIAVAATAPSTSAIRCSGCGRVFEGARGYLDLRPRARFAERTKYLDDALHADARHESVSPPLLGSKIRNDMLRRFLALRSGDCAIDLGCGSGRVLLWNAGSGATLVGIDISAFFASEALDRSDLLLGDLRRLPLKDGTFTKAWSLDVLEHLSPEALRDVLTEANRVLAANGALFIYTHVRQNGWLAGGVRLVNRVARLCERLGLLDLELERLRKSDHVNPIANHDELARVMDECGFRIERMTYYTPVVGAFIENILVRIAERVAIGRARRSSREASSTFTDAAAARAARASAKARIAHRGLTYRVLQALSALMKLDVLLFGRVRSGPFFALVRKAGPTKTGTGHSALGAGGAGGSAVRSSAQRSVPRA